MSRFTDRIETDLEQIAEQASPSSNAWQAIQQRMAEPDTTRTGEIIMLTADDTENEAIASPPHRGRTWMAVAAAVAIVAVAAGVLLSGGDEEGLVVADQPDTEDTIEDRREQTPATTVAPTSTEPERAITQILPGFTLSAGTYETDTLGMTMQLTLTEQMRATWIRPGEFQLIDQESGSRFVVVARIGGWPTLEESSDPSFSGQGSIAPADVDTWIADNQMIASQRDDVIIDGRPAVVFDVRTDPEVQGSLTDEFKQNLVYSVAEPSFDAELAVSPDRTIVPELSLRLWLVDVEGFTPIAIFAAAAPGPPDAPDAADGWLDEFERTILPTIEFGPDAPSKPLE